MIFAPVLRRTGRWGWRECPARVSILESWVEARRNFSTRTIEWNGPACNVRVRETLYLSFSRNKTQLYSPIALHGSRYAVVSIWPCAGCQHGKWLKKAIFLCGFGHFASGDRQARITAPTRPNWSHNLLRSCSVPSYRRALFTRLTLGIRLIRIPTNETQLYLM